MKSFKELKVKREKIDQQIVKVKVMNGVSVDALKKEYSFTLRY